MSTKREQILAAATAALTNVTGVQDADIFRSRAAAFMKKDFPAIVIEPVSDIADNPNLHRLEWQLNFQVAILLRSDTADTDADTTIASVHNKIMTDATLQGLVTNILPTQTSWQFTDADAQFGLVSMQFLASYQTDLNTL